VRRAHEREKQLLLEDTKRVVAELERFSDSCLRLQSEKRAMEEELSELRSKQAAVAQWEAQISEIIQWVSDEKDARGYLQALTSKMTEEMENLKTQGVGGTPSNVRQTIRPKHSLPPLVELNFLIDSNCFVICRKRTGRTGDLRN
jgi:serine/threonine-protein kinase MRCK